MTAARPSRRRRWQRFFSFAVASAFGSGLVAIATLAWSVHAHGDQQRNEASKNFLERRQLAYEELMRIAGEAARTPLTPEEYDDLHKRFYKVYGTIEIYGTRELASCTTTLRDTLYSCAHPVEPKLGDACDMRRLTTLYFRLGSEARLSLGRTWDQHPRDFVDDRLAPEPCAI